MSDPQITTLAEPPGTIIRYIFGFILIGIAWGFTTPFIRAAARNHKPPAHPILESPSVTNSWFKTKVYGAFFGVVDLLRNPRYAIPLVINLTGSVWFFLLIGKAGAFCLSDAVMRVRWMLTERRTEFDCSNYQFVGFLVYGVGGLVCRSQGDWKGYAYPSLK